VRIRLRKRFSSTRNRQAIRRRETMEEEHMNKMEKKLLSMMSKRMRSE